MSRLSHLDHDNSEFVETDPTGRYGRYNEVLGRGARKTVYRAFDEIEGIEVAWNQVKLYDQTPEDFERLKFEILLLGTLEHDYIMKLHTAWLSDSENTLNFVTEIFSYSLRQYRLKHKRVNISAVKHWCRQILRGLAYLHHHRVYPLIHRDLKCDNIFINGNEGKVKIGDLGLATVLGRPDTTFVGTPGFMAPEAYEGKYNSLVDIYSFGMCILEMVTMEYPYSECADPSEIYKKVISGEKPHALYKMKDEEVKEFVEKCLAPVSRRPSATELLYDPFLIQPVPRKLDFVSYFSDIFNQSGTPGRKPSLELHDNSDSQVKNHPNGDSYEAQNQQNHGVEIESSLIKRSGNLDHERSGDVDTNIKGKRSGDGGIFLRFRFADKKGRIRKIYFPFDVIHDTSLHVATEMVAELDITEQDVTIIANMIETEISFLVPEWKPEPAKYSQRLGNANNERYNHGGIKPSVLNVMARGKRQDPFTNNPLGLKPSVCLEPARGSVPRNVSSYPANNATNHLRVPPKDLQAVPERECVSEQASLHLADKAAIHLGVFLKDLQAIQERKRVSEQASLHLANNATNHLRVPPKDLQAVPERECVSEQACLHLADKAANHLGVPNIHHGVSPKDLQAIPERERVSEQASFHLTDKAAIHLGVSPKDLQAIQERKRVYEQAWLHLANNARNHLRVPPKDLQAVPERECLSEQACLHLADKAGNHLRVPTIPLEVSPKDVQAILERERVFEQASLHLADMTTNHLRVPNIHLGVSSKDERERVSEQASLCLVNTGANHLGVSPNDLQAVPENKRVSEQASLHLADKAASHLEFPTIHLGISPNDLKANPGRERVPEQASLHLADKAANDLGVPNIHHGVSPKDLQAIPERERISEQASLHLTDKAANHLGVSPKDLQAIPERKRVSEQASLLLANNATNHLRVPPKAPTTDTLQPVPRRAPRRPRFFL